MNEILGLRSMRKTSQNRRSSPLRTWQLIPIDHASLLWQCSSSHDELIVRAPSPVRARSLAAEKFRQPPSKPSCRAEIASPWLDAQLVRCVWLRDERFDGYDEEVVLDCLLGF
jgi:hypothetical protein